MKSGLRPSCPGPASEQERLMLKGGRSFISSPPAFSNDAKKLLICTGNTVSVFSTSTGLQITELEGHTALVSSIVIAPASTPASKILCYCWTASLDGTIRHWDFSVPELMKKIDIRFPIYSMVIPILFIQSMETQEKTHDLFAYVSTAEANQQDKQPNALHGKIRKCNLTKSCLAGGVTLAEVQVHIVPRLLYALESNGASEQLNNQRRGRDDIVRLRSGVFVDAETAELFFAREEE
ncbi:hypothetical protein RHMOL_Rhmol13G0156700 [Rhododendron molle]|uniref:Uncharacterized protein n=1 Tax=Rhododendron molle TaxID=49168 RepID=A0ACC0L8J0_RHOML|nr:hypothetical protein RHMOL_Rhmol13G0156700 [Rhododendron molle]